MDGHNPAPLAIATPWRRVASRVVCRGHWIRVRENTIELPDRTPGLYGAVESGPRVNILPLVDSGTVLLFHRYRYLAGRVTLKVTTGSIAAGESPVAARRESKEEAG